MRQWPIPNRSACKHTTLSTMLMEGTLIACGALYLYFVLVLILCL